MTKEEIKSGMIVVTGKGTYTVQFPYLVDDCGIRRSDIRGYDSDLTLNNYPDSAICKIYDSNNNLLWERPKTTVSMEQICTLFGLPAEYIDIVK